MVDKESDIVVQVWHVKTKEDLRIDTEDDCLKIPQMEVGAEDIDGVISALQRAKELMFSEASR